jgi:hypothetical protein
LDPDSDPDPNPGFESRSETGQNFFFVLKFLPSFIFKNKKAAFPQLHDLASNKVTVPDSQHWFFAWRILH